jgi:hypothetical protein
MLPKRLMVSMLGRKLSLDTQRLWILDECRSRPGMLRLNRVASLRVTTDNRR